MSLSVLHPTVDAMEIVNDSMREAHSSWVMTGHSGEVFACDFDDSGKYAASAGFDRTIFIWSLSEGGFQNSCVMRGHTNAILQVKWSHSDATKLFTASADKSVAWWDVIEGQRVKKLAGHTSIVNACALSKSASPIGVSGADDGTVKLWDLRDRKCVSTFEHTYQILSVDISNDRVFAGTIDDSILVLDMRTMDQPLDVLTTENNIDSVTSVSLSNDGDSMLSLSMNGTAHLWDVRPFCPAEDRLLYTYHRITNNFGMNLLRIHWSPDDLVFSVGSSDNCVNVHKVRPGLNDMDTSLCVLGGHTGVVHEAVFHPNERYSILSGSGDKSLLYGPLPGEDH